MTRVLIFSTADTLGIHEVDANPDQIVSAVNGGSWETYFPGIRGPLFAREQGDVVVVTQTPDAVQALHAQLSRREHEVLVLLGEGLTTAQIAIRLGLRPRTIRGYVANMKARLHAQNIQQLVARAVALGLFRPQVE